MNNQPQNKILPENATQAARVLIKLSHTLVNLADSETQALIQDDFVTFSILQDEKELIAHRYAAASAEFRSRIEDFRGLDSALLDQMSALQNSLADKTRSNNIIVAKLRQRSEKKAHGTLFTIQDLAQQKPVRFETSQEERV